MADYLKVKSLINNKYSENIKLSEKKCDEADRLISSAISQKSSDQKGIAIKALNLYQEALELNSRQVRAHMGIAYLFLATGNIDDALGILNTVLEFEPFNTNAQKMISELKNVKKSSIISNISSKSLSETLREKSSKVNFIKSGSSIFEQITSIIKSTMNTKKNTKSKISGSNDFESFLKETSKKMNLPPR